MTPAPLRIVRDKLRIVLDKESGIPIPFASLPQPMCRASMPILLRLRWFFRRSRPAVSAASAGATLLLLSMMASGNLVASSDASSPAQTAPQMAPPKASIDAAQAVPIPHPAQEFIERAAAAVRSDPQDSHRAAMAALELLVRQPDADLEIRAHLLLCDYYFERDRAIAETHVARARTLLPEAKRKGLRAGLLNCEGAILETVGDNVRAGELYDEAIAVAQETGDQEMLATALYSRGYLLGLRARYAAALMDLKRTQVIYDELGLPDHALTALNAIAIMYNRMGDYEHARNIYAQALTAQRAAGMYREVGVTLHNLGRAHENLLAWDEAREAFEQSLEISRGLEYERGEAYALRGLAAVANGEGDPKRALTILDQAAAIQRGTPDARLRAQIELTRGISLHRLNQLPQSVAALTEALGVFEQAESRQELLMTYTELASVQAAMGDWEQGYSQLLSAQKTSERLYRNQIDQRFATLKIEFDTAGKDKENALLVRENEANQKALAQERRARHLQAAVIALTAALAVLLATLTIHQWRTTRRMRALAMTDELTGVPNRRAVLSHLPSLLKSSGASGCALMIIDIDYFKRINDEHGHAEGDEALKLVAAALRDAVREPASLGRLGGEEFVILLPNSSIEYAQMLAERIRLQVMSIDTRRWLAKRRITVSIGLTLSVAGGDTPSGMLQRADAALYDAKRAGRNCVRVSLLVAGTAPEDEAAREEAAATAPTDATGPEFA